LQVNISIHTKSVSVCGGNQGYHISCFSRLWPLFLKHDIDVRDNYFSDAELSDWLNMDLATDKLKATQIKYGWLKNNNFSPGTYSCSTRSWKVYKMKDGVTCEKLCSWG